MDDLITNLLSLLETQFSTTFKSYTYGKIIVPGGSSLPMITVSPVKTEVSNSGTVRDKNLFTVRVTVMDNLKKYLDNTNGEGDKLDSLQQLVKWVEDRNSDGSVKDSTIIAVIRQNITASNAVLYNNNLDINYDDYYVEGDFPTIRAEITFTAELRSNRK